MSAPPPAPLLVDLEWEGDLRFRGRSGESEILMDSPPKAGPTPVQLLGFGLAGCMAMEDQDVIELYARAPLGTPVHIVEGPIRDAHDADRDGIPGFL